jgi:hypothetical protein
MSPVAMVGAFMIPVYFFVFLVPELLGTESLQLKARVFFDWKYFGMGLLFLTTVLVGALFGTYLQPEPDDARATREPWVSNWVMDAIALATIGAYLIWFRGVLSNPAEFVGALFGQAAYGVSRQDNQTIGGVTTLTQCGIAYTVLYLDRMWALRKPFTSVRYHWYFAIILLWGALRVKLWSERLALIELVVPIAVMFFCYRADSRLWFMRLLRRFGPLLGVVGLVVLFAVGEYFRSWRGYYQFVEDDFWAFIRRRLITYYYTALNNGSGLLENYDWPTYEFQFTLQWLYRFPALIGPIFRYAFDVSQEYRRFVVDYADPEFNNMSGLFTHLYDMGLGLGLVYAIAWGGLCGYAFSCVKARRGFPRLLYPILFLSLLEVLRVPYLGDVRAFPALAALVFGYLLFRERRVERRGHGSRFQRRSVATIRGPGWFARSAGLLRRR